MGYKYDISNVSDLIVKMFFLRILLMTLSVSYIVAGPIIIESQKPELQAPLHITVAEKEFYLGVHLKLNFYEAVEFCRYHGMRLATINSQEENDKLFAYMNLMGIQEHVWLSGSDLGHEGKFVWLSTGAPLIFQNFMNGQPDNSNKVEHCLEIWQFGRWNDIPCTNLYNFACEF